MTRDVQTFVAGRRADAARPATPPRRRFGRQFATAVMAFAATAWWSTTAFAQLDPLLFVKRVPPTIILVVDTSLRMLEDGAGRFYDPATYSTNADAGAVTALGVPLASNSYRRIYHNLRYENVQDSNSKFYANDITAVPDTSAAYSTFWDQTRLQIAKRGIEGAVTENRGPTFRWGLIRLRQSSPAWRTSPNCDKPVRITDNLTLQLASDTSPCNAGAAGRYGIYTPVVSSPNYSIESQYGGGALVVVPGNNTSSTVLSVVTGAIGNGGLIPASVGAATYEDRPIAHALDDARAAAATAMANDTASNRTCRNTVVVLITGGKDEGDASYDGSHDPLPVASSFLNVSGGGVTRRVPIHVIGVKVGAADKVELEGIAANSAGRYTDATTVSDVTAAINYAVQTGFSRSTDFNTGTLSEYQPVSPVVGTVNLKNAYDADGTLLPNTDITSVPPASQPLPQRSNVLITAGFALPGYEGRLRAFRTYKPEPDLTKPSGWSFVADGTRLWPDLDGRPALAGMARTPADPAQRNIYTFVPGSGVVAFDAANATTLAPHMGPGVDASALISYVRSQPLGAIIGSTPALMDPPSLDPPPDDDYGRSDAAGSYAAKYKSRRSIIFIGANDGMIHAIDARTGYEVWAFIPYNLLPKLRTLVDGQPVEQFEYFVDSSPKVAEVKIGGEWRTLLIIGQGPGGTFYQAFDVTEAGMGVDPSFGDLSAVNSLLAKFDSADETIKFKWSFPNYSSFDTNYRATFSVSDGTPGGRIRLYGDVRDTASNAEKSVGFTWSDPAVGPLNASRSISAVIAGSGYFPAVEDVIPNRLAASPRAGNVLYLLDPDTGNLIGNSTGSCPDANTAMGCISVGDVTANGRKNALQADPTAAGEAGSHVVTKAYLGDIDGRYWRFNLTEAGSITRVPIHTAGAPIYASSALLFIGTVDVYVFFATGSDLLPTTAPGGVGTFELIGLKDNYPFSPNATVKFSIDLATVTNVGGIATGERPSTSPSVAGDIVFYTTTTESASTPCADFTANLYALTYVGGAAYDAYTSSNDKLDKNESPIVRTLQGRATAPFIVDQHLYFGTAGAQGSRVEAFGDPEDFNNGIGQVGVRILSWREIR